MGRHPALLERYGDAETLQRAIDEWFASFMDVDTDNPSIPHVPTFSGLALLLGFDSTRALWNYANAEEGSERGEFRSPIKKATAAIDGIYESRLASGKPVGSIFALKNRGWTDQQDHRVELAGDGWGAILAGIDKGTSEGNPDDGEG